MGVLYSTWNYLASFTQWAPQKLEATKINLSSQKLCHALRLKQIKLQQNTKQIETKLINMIHSPMSSEKIIQGRSLPMQQEIMQQIVLNSEILAAYEEVIRCANVIKNQADRIEKNAGSISPECQLAILTIIYANKALELDDIILMGQYVPKKIQSSVTEKDISKPLREYVQSSRNASFEAINFYALQMCSRNNISLDKVNEIGHGFRYNPNQWGFRQSKSSQMFAVQLQEIQMPFELEEKNSTYWAPEKQYPQKNIQSNNPYELPEHFRKEEEQTKNKNNQMYAQQYD